MLSLQVRGVNFLKVLLVGGVFSVSTVFAQSGEKLDPALIKKGAGKTHVMGTTSGCRDGIVPKVLEKLFADPTTTMRFNFKLKSRK